MGKRIPVVTVAEPAAAARLAHLPLEASVAMADVAGAIKHGLLAFASTTGLLVMHQMLEAELTGLIGPKHARIPGRHGSRHGSTAGSVILGGRKVAAQRPRAPAALEAYNANYVGGDINGGLQSLAQFFTRPAVRFDPYSTPDPELFICSSSTPPGGGVHGLCGWHATRSALRGVLR